MLPGEWQDALAELCLCPDNKSTHLLCLKPRGTSKPAKLLPKGYLQYIYFPYLLTRHAVDNDLYRAEQNAIFFSLTCGKSYNFPPGPQPFYWIALALWFNFLHFLNFPKLVLSARRAVLKSECSLVIEPGAVLFVNTNHRATNKATETD